MSTQINYGPFCEENNCPEFIRWGVEGGVCESCKLVGQSYEINEFPPDCLFLKAIEEYKLKKEKTNNNGFH